MVSTCLTRGGDPRAWLPPWPALPQAMHDLRCGGLRVGTGPPPDARLSPLAIALYVARDLTPPAGFCTAFRDSGTAARSHADTVRPGMRWPGVLHPLTGQVPGPDLRPLKIDNCL